MSKKTNIGTLFGVISLDAKQYMAAIRSVRMQTVAMATSVGRSFSTVRNIVAGAFVTAAAMRGLSAAKSQVTSILDLATQTRSSAMDMQVYRRAANLAEAANLNLAGAIESVSKRQADALAGNKKAIADFQALKITMEEIEDLRPGQMFERVVSSLDGLSHAAERTSIAAKVLGGDARNLGYLMEGGGRAFREAREQIEGTWRAISVMDVAKFRVASRAMAEMRSSIADVATRLYLELTPAIFTFGETVKRMIDSVDWNSVGKRLGFFIRNTIVLFSNLGTYVNYVWQNIKLVALRILHDIEGRLVAFGQSMIRSVQGLSGMFGSVAKTVVTEFFTPLVQEQSNFADAVLDTEFTIMQLASTLKKAGLTTEFETQIDEMINRLSALKTQVSETVKGIGQMFQEGFTAAFSSLSGVIADAFTEGEFRAKDFAKSIVNTMIRTFAQLAIVNPLLNYIFGGGIFSAASTGFTNLPTLSGTPMAEGGSVAAGRTYLTGEEGAELFTPSTSGYIVPNDVLRAAGGKSQGRGDVFIDARGADREGLKRLENIVLGMQMGFKENVMGTIHNWKKNGGRI